MLTILKEEDKEKALNEKKEHVSGIVEGEI